MECLTVAIKTLSPVVLTAMNNAAVMTESRDYISGTVLRGVLAARFIEMKNLGKAAHEDTEFKKLFLGGLRFIAAYPVVRGKRSFVLPFSLQKGKIPEKNAEGLEELLDVMRQKPKAGYKAMKGFAVAEQNCISPVSVRKQVKLHMSRNSEKERLSGRSLEGNIYNYEAIEAGQEFEGMIVGEKEDLELLLARLQVAESGMSCRIGRSKYTEYGLCRLTMGHVEPISVERPEGKRLCLRLETSWLPKAGEKELSVMTSAENVIGAFAKDLAQNLGADDIKVSRVIAKEENEASFVGVWGMRRPEIQSIAAGSVFALEKTSGWDEKAMNQLCEQLYAGQGDRTEEGFGQLRVWNVDAPVLKEFADNDMARRKISSVRVKEIAGTILQQRILNLIRLQAKEDVQVVKGRIGNATHSFARLENLLGERKDLAQAKNRFQQKLETELREQSVLDKRLQNLEYKGKGLKEILLGTAPAPYDSAAFKTKMNEEINPELAEDIGFVLPNAEDGALFYEYWLWFFRHGRKLAVRRKGEK